MNLVATNLSHANLTGANLFWANLSHANLTGANLSGANLSGANFTDCKHLSFSQIAEAKWDFGYPPRNLPTQLQADIDEQLSGRNG